MHNIEILKEVYNNLSSEKNQIYTNLNSTLKNPFYYSEPILSATNYIARISEIESQQELISVFLEQLETERKKTESDKIESEASNQSQEDETDETQSEGKQ